MSEVFVRQFLDGVQLTIGRDVDHLFDAYGRPVVYACMESINSVQVVWLRMDIFFGQVFTPGGHCPGENGVDMEATTQFYTFTLLGYGQSSIYGMQMIDQRLSLGSVLFSSNGSRFFTRIFMCN